MRRLKWLCYVHSFCWVVAGLVNVVTRLQRASDLHMHLSVAAYRAIGARLAPNFTLTCLARLTLTWLLLPVTRHHETYIEDAAFPAILKNRFALSHE